MHFKFNFLVFNLTMKFAQRVSCKLMLTLYSSAISIGFHKASNLIFVLFNLTIKLAQKASIHAVAFFDVLFSNNRGKKKQNKNIVMFFSYLLNNIPNIFVVWAKQHAGRQKKNLWKQTKQNYEEAKTHILYLNFFFRSSLQTSPTSLSLFLSSFIYLLTLLWGFLPQDLSFLRFPSILKYIYMTRQKHTSCTWTSSFAVRPKLPQLHYFSFFLLFFLPQDIYYFCRFLQFWNSLFNSKSRTFVNISWDKFVTVFGDKSLFVFSGDGVSFKALDL